MDLVGFVGFQNSGKNTAALILENLGYQQISFADSLKDCLASIFQWPREMLDGTTPESRAWREQVDTWWAERLGIPDFTPRMAMQQVGTNALRRHFHEDIWVSSVEKKIENGGKFVFTDLRYPNEINLVRKKGGMVIRIKKGDEPIWYELAKNFNHETKNSDIPLPCEEEYEYAQYIHPFKTKYGHVHETEYAWIGCDLDCTIENNGTVEELHEKVLSFVFS